MPRRAPDPQPTPGQDRAPPPPEPSPGLDLMRATAIMLVLVCHFYLMERSWAKAAPIWQIAVCGFIGVQLFFVLSGFLIGRILLRLAGVGTNTPPRSAGRAGAAAWRRWLIFMVRRWMRTLPLYWSVLLLLGWFWPPSFWVPHNGQLLPHLLAYGSFTQNLFWPMPDGWFAVSWSLAVEEWFYLIVSALLLGLARLVKPNIAVLAVLLVFLLAPPLLRLHSLTTPNWRPADAQLVPFWFDALATGVLTSWILRLRIGRAARLSALVLGLALVGFVWTGGLGWLRVVEPISRSLNDELLSIGFALCIPASLMLRTLPAPIGLVVHRLSRWSYCLYLTHLSILEIGGYYRLRWQVTPVWLALVCLVLSLATAWFSWRFFEAPILRLRPAERKEAVLF